MPDMIDGVDQERAPIGTAELQPLAVIDGTPDDDVLVGTPEDDLIRGFGGNDDVRGLAGNDEIHGGAGNDVLRGGPGHDTIFGGLGDDTIRGGDGNDTLYGGDGDDLIQGLAGNDVIVGGEGNDELRGGGGDDVIRGGPGNDQIFGGGGDDELFGGAGNDVIEGREGNDLIVGGDGADQLFGGPGNDVIRGGPGNDLLVGGQGDDELRGNQGDDILDGKRGADTMWGGFGADTFRFTVFDQVLNRVEDFDLDQGDRLDLREVVDFQTGDDLDNFVRFQQVAAGTRVSIDPNGPVGGANFGPLALLVGTEIESLTLAQLGLSGALISDSLVGSSNAEGEAANGPSFVPSLSDDGQFLTFSSAGTNLVEDADEDFDVYLKDIVTGDVVLISDTDGSRSDVSGDGSSVAWESFGGGGIFVADVVNGTVTEEAVPDAGFKANPSISTDGQRVAFEAGTGVFVFERGDDESTNVSDPSEEEPANGNSFDPDISADGQWVAFASDATNLVAGDLNASTDIFIRAADGTGDIELVSETVGEEQGVGNSTDPSVSANGQFVAFASAASFVAEDGDGFTDIYLKDLGSGEITLVSSPADGMTSGDGNSFTPAISNDGRFVAFRSEAENLTADDGDGTADIFVKDTVSGNIVRFAVDDDTSDLTNPFVLAPALSGDGTLVAYVDNVELVGGSLTGGQGDVIVAPVDFGAGGALSVADVLDPGERGSGPAGGGGAAMAPTSLEAMLAPDEVAVAA